jgi:hypothetical protein
VALYTVATGQSILAQDINQIINVLTGSDTATQVTVSNRIQAQLAGATTASGYVGGVAGAAPTTGTFLQGDMVIDGTSGCAWVCQVAGSPGSWKRVGTSGYVARWHRNASQTLTVSTSNLIQMDGSDYDPHGMWNASTHGYVIPFGGATWRITGRCSGQWSSSPRAYTSIFVNGSEASRGWDGQTSNSYGGGSVSDLLRLNSGDLVQLAFWVGATGATETETDGAEVYLSIALADQ